MYVLSSFSSLSEALVEEKIMILKYKKLGFDLTNKESGRPKVSDKVSLVTFTVPESEIEYAKSLAAQEGKTLPQIMQRFLREYLDDLVK
jgi:hypothetical protein